MGRLLLILKNLRRNIRRILSPQRVEVVRMNGNRIGEDVLNNTNTYLAAYGVILVGSFLLISIDGLSMTTMCLRLLRALTISDRDLMWWDLPVIFRCIPGFPNLC